MAQPMTTAQLEQARLMIDSGNLAGFYSYMTGQGYNYAILANGLVTGTSLSGEAAVNYLIASAQAQGVNFTASQLPALETDMANKWVDALEDVANANGTVNGDLTYQQTLAFHTSVFADFDLGPQTWTLYTPGQVLSPQYMESTWQTMLSQMGTPLVGPLASEAALTLDMTEAASNTLNPQSAQVATNWLTQNAFNLGSDFSGVFASAFSSSKVTEPNGAAVYTDANGDTLTQYQSSGETVNVWSFPVTTPTISVTSLEGNTTVNASASSNATVSAQGSIEVSDATVSVSGTSASSSAGSNSGAVNIQGTNNGITVQSGNVSVSGGGNTFSLNGNASDSTFTLEGTGTNADTLNVAGATDLTVLLGDTTTAVNLVSNATVTVNSLNGGGTVTGTTGDSVTVLGVNVTLNATGGQYNINGTGDAVNTTNSTIAVATGGQATLVGTGNSFSVGAGGSLTVDNADASGAPTVVTADSSGNTTIQFDGSSVLLGPVGQEISQASNGALTVATGSGGTAQVALADGTSTGTPVAFSGVESMTLNPDGSYSIVDQSGNAYTLQPVDGSSDYLLGNSSGTMNVTLDASAVTSIDLGQSVSVGTLAGGTLTIPASGGSGTLDLGSLGNATISDGSAVSIGANTIDVSEPGAGTTDQFQFTSDGTVSGVATYDGSSAQSTPVSVASFNSDGVQTQLLTNNANGTSQVTLLNAGDPTAGFITQTQNFSGGNGTGSLVNQITDFTDGSSEVDAYNPSQGIAVTKTVYSDEDGQGDVLSTTTNFSNGTSAVTTYAGSGDSDSSGLSANGLTSQTVTYSGWDGTGDVQNTTYGTASGGSNVPYSQLGNVLGSKIGQILGGNSIVESIGYSAVLGTLGTDVGKIISVDTADGSTVGDISKTIDNLASNALPDVAEAGAGAVGAYLTGEFVKDLGITGLPAQIIDTGAGYEVATIASNLAAEAAGNTSVQWSTGLANSAGLVNAFAGFAGVEVASLVVTWSTSAEADISSIGAAIGGIAGSYFGPIGTFVGSFLGDLLGGLIGSIFGGKPNPYVNGTLLLNSQSGEYSYQITRLKDNGPASYLNGIGNAIATELNAVIADVGGTVSDAQALSGSLLMAAEIPSSTLFVQDGPSKTSEDSASFNINDSSDFIDWTVFDQLSKLSFNGGDAYVERAINATVAQYQAGGGGVNLETLLGNIQIAQDYEKYLSNENTINGLIAQNPTSSFSAGWIIELQQAASLNLENASLGPFNQTLNNELDYYGVVAYSLNANQIENIISGNFSSPVLNNVNWGSRSPSNIVTLYGTDISLQLNQSNLPMVTDGNGDKVRITGNSNAFTLNGSYSVFTGIGNSTVVTANGDFDTASVFGNGNLLTVNGQYASIVLSGSGNQLTNANGTVTVADNSSATINGVSETIDLWNDTSLVVNGGQMAVTVGGDSNSVTTNGNNEQISVNGNSNNVVGNGQGDTVSISGTNESLTLGSGNATLADGVAVAANGENFNIAVGNADDVTVSGQNIGVSLAGQGDSVTVNGMSAGVSGNTFSSAITANGSENSILLTGNDNSLTANGFGGYFANAGNGVGGRIEDSGDDNTLTTNGQQFRMEATGSGNTLTENGNFGYMSANGNSNIINANGQGIDVQVDGGNNVVAIGNGNVSFASGSTAVLDGVADGVALSNSSSVTVNGGNMTVSIVGTQDTLTANGDQSTLNVQGAANVLTANGSGIDVNSTGNSNNFTLNGNLETLFITGSGNTFQINGQQNTATLNGTGNTVHSSGLTATVLDNGSAEFDGGGDSVSVSNSDSVTLNGSGFAVSETDTDSTVTINGDYESATVGGNTNSIAINGNSGTVQMSGELNSVTITGLAATVGVSGVQQTLTDNQGNITIAAGSQVNLVGNGSIVTLGQADTLTVEGSNNWVNVATDDAVTMTSTGNGIGGTASGVTAVLDGNGQYAILSNDAITVGAGIQASVTGNANSVSVGAGGTLDLTGNGNWLQMSGSTLVLADSGSTAGSDPETGKSQSGFAVNGFDFTSYSAGQFSSAAGAQSLQSLADTGANSASLVVTQYVQSVTDTDIEPTSATESDASLEQAIAEAQADGLSVTLKPHLDVSDGTWRADLDPSNVAQFFTNYQAMIVHYAQIAQATGVGMLVIGTEMESLSGSAYEPYWDTLIAAVRQVYSGKLTYASGWNETANVSFWNKLDVIGADAYIPVTAETDPTLQQLEAGWTTVSSNSTAASAMNNLSPLAFYQGMAAEYNEPVLFTELGYQSVNDTNQLEGAFGTSNWVDFQQQSQALQAFFSTFSQNGGNWFEGAYLWNWEADPAGVGANDFSVQGKPGLNVVDYWYGLATGSQSGSGSPNTLTGDSNTVTVGDGDALNIVGDDNNVTLGANGAVNVDGQGNTVQVTGGNNLIQTSDATAITLSGAGTTAMILGDGDTISASGAQNGVALNGSNATVTLSGDTDALTVSGNGSTINVDGNGDTVSLTGTGNVIDVTGNNALIQTNGATTVVVGGTAGSTTIAGGGNTIQIEGSANSVSVTGSGSSIVVGDGGANVTLDSGSYQVSAGNGNTTITAGDGADVVSVGSGTNSIVLGNGADTVTLGNGTDTVTLGSGADTVMLGNGSSTIAVGGDDTIEISVAAGDSTNTASALITAGSSAAGQSNGLAFGSADSDQIWFSRSNNDLLISVIGTSSEIDISNWYSNPNTMESITAADGKVLAGDDVNALVNAMAAFSPPAAGSTSLPESYQSQLQPVLAANWH